MVQTNNLNVLEVTPIIAPSDLKQVFPLPLSGANFVNASRNTIKSILNKEDERLLVVVGPCSIHDPLAAIEYAKRLVKLAEELQKLLQLRCNASFLLRHVLQKPSPHLLLLLGYQRSL